MSEEGNSSPNKNNVATPEMSPENDGTKVPLTNSEAAKVEEAKYKKADSKIDVGVPKTFTGLTKEELMKYSTDPFWIKLRMALFILFWLAWAAMLVLAIVIIIQAPACEPPPTRPWVEEQAMIEISKDQLPTFEELETKMESTGTFSAYFPDFISPSDFFVSTYVEAASSLIESLVKVGKDIVIDLPLTMSKDNSLYDNATDGNFLNDDDSWNYTNPNLPSAMIGYFLTHWIDQGVKGFLIPEADADEVAVKTTFKEKLNELLKESDAAVGSNVVKFKPIERSFGVSKFKDFLTENSDHWSFYRFSPVLQMIGSMNNEEERLVTIGLYLFGGTPILTKFDNLSNTTNELLKELSSKRSLQGLKLGAVNMVNDTNNNVVAFTRTYKGTPAYAIALNFNNENANVSFSGTPNLFTEGTDGNVEIDSQPDTLNIDSKVKLELLNLELKPYQGLVLQFVGNF